MDVFIDFQGMRIMFWRGPRQSLAAIRAIPFWMERISL
jgi:hypothetical protein